MQSYASIKFMLYLQHQNNKHPQKKAHNPKANFDKRFAIYNKFGKNYAPAIA